MVGSRDELPETPGEHQGDLGTDPGWVLVRGGTEAAWLCRGGAAELVGRTSPHQVPLLPMGPPNPQGLPTLALPPPHGPGQLFGAGEATGTGRGLATAVRPLATVCLAALALNSLIPGGIFSARKGRAKLGGWECGRPLCRAGTAAQGSAFGVAGESSREDPRGSALGS